ncbi:hypothetical protein [Halobacillus sp. A5]|uniref:hypothetical protein n=1 Tax=Halobacillus sp. A5 TaxID=2880263 RepID=UPI0020A6483B|nr:hypothetical protein [Halobacillus sp. A5]MCP3025411.1 hypothetical protein [Halobacillus sp. A5]
MSNYVVVKSFKDLQDNKYQYQKGAAYPRNGINPDDDRIKELSGSNNNMGKVLIKQVEEDKPNHKYPLHTGGSWYQLSNGEKVQGKDKAYTSQQELDDQ